MIGILGVRNSIKEGVHELIQRLHSVNCKIWLVTGDVKEMALNCAVDIGLIDQNKEERLSLTGKCMATLTVEVRNILAEIKEILEKNPEC